MNADSIHITPEMLPLTAEIDEFKGAWRALGTLAPECLKALRHVATVESIGSSTRIEGSELTERDIERLVSSFDKGTRYQGRYKSLHDDAGAFDTQGKMNRRDV